MGGLKSRDKGKRGEREAVAYLTQIGFPDARRTQQYNGMGLSDVICPESLPELHIEVKRTETIGLGTVELSEALEQAERDSDGNPWCVLWRRSRQKWRLTFCDPWRVPFTVCGDVDIALILRNSMNRRNPMTVDQPASAAFCAEKVMGWNPPGHPDTLKAREAWFSAQSFDGHWLNPNGRLTPEHDVPNPFTSWDDDGAVLVHVRETWDGERYRKFAVELNGIWFTSSDRIPGNSDDWPELGTVYQPGDYCVAACRVIQGGDDAYPLRRKTMTSDGVDVTNRTLPNRSE